MRIDSRKEAQGYDLNIRQRKRIGIPYSFFAPFALLCG